MLKSSLKEQKNHVQNFPGRSDNHQK